MLVFKNFENTALRNLKQPEMVVNNELIKFKTNKRMKGRSCIALDK